MIEPRDFYAIAAVNDHDILSRCLQLSPDIADGTLPLIVVEHARSMADAYNRGLKQARPGICLFAHQDVYLPAGFLERAASQLNALTQAHPEWMVAGPYGVTPARKGVGRVWDTVMNQELGTRGFEPTAVASLDELLLILRWDGSYRFDEDLPHFHLYGTDLVQTAWEQGRSAWAVELPIVHNNRPITSLGGGYTAAYRYARAKWRNRLPIPTTICDLTYNPLALARARWRRRKVSASRGSLLADSLAVARLAGYE